MTDTLSNLYLNINKLKKLNDFERDHFIYMHKELIKLCENHHNEMKNYSSEILVKIPYNNIILHLYNNLVKHGILVSERELSIDNLLTD